MNGLVQRCLKYVIPAKSGIHKIKDPVEIETILPGTADQPTGTDMTSYEQHLAVHLMNAITQENRTSKNLSSCYSLNLNHIKRLIYFTTLAQYMPWEMNGDL